MWTLARKKTSFCWGSMSFLPFFSGMDSCEIQGVIARKMHLVPYYKMVHVFSEDLRNTWVTVKNFQTRGKTFY